MDFYHEFEIEPDGELDNNIKKTTIRKYKMKCNLCGHIDYTLKYPECGYAMFKYRSPF